MSLSSFSTRFSASAVVKTAGRAVVAALLLWSVGGKAGYAQPTPTPTPPPLQKPNPTKYDPQPPAATVPPNATPYPLAQDIHVHTGDKQSPLNPFPNGFGNAQGRGKADEFYWGIGDANLFYIGNPLGRVPNRAASFNASIFQNVGIDLDGWTFSQTLGFDPNSVNSVQRDPRANDPRSGSRRGRLTNIVPQIRIDDQEVVGSNVQTGFAANWASVTAPSTGANAGAAPASTTAGYTRASAKARPNIAAISYMTRAGAFTANAFVYEFNNISTPNAATTRIPGVYGAQTRFRISVTLPEDIGDTTEQRVTDARYMVFFYIRGANGQPVAKQKTFTLSQLGSGTIGPMNNTVGGASVPAVVPFYSNESVNGVVPAGVTPLVFPNQPGLNRPFQGVVLDDSSGDVGTGSNLYVLADALVLDSGTDAIYATPTVVAQHGGRKISAYDFPTLTRNANGVPLAAGGIQPQQPRAFLPSTGATQYNNRYTRDPITDTTVPAAPTGTTALTNDAFNDRNPATLDAFGNPVRDTTNTPGFINNPRDPIYDPGFPVGTNALYDPTMPYESWNPSTLFMGPEALLDPRLKVNPNNPLELGLPLRPGTTNRPLVAITDAVTGQAYTGNGKTGRTPANASNANNFNVYPAPYFSQSQVVMARTEFVPDPETGVADDEKDGTLVIQVGAVYGVDWQTGAPIWRFPDKSYLPGRVRNPVIYQGVRTDPDPFLRITQYQIPGMVLVDKNGNGSSTTLFKADGTPDYTLDDDIEDEEVYIGAQSGNISGALFASITFAPQVAVQGRVNLPVYKNPGTLTAFNKTGRYLQTKPGFTVEAPAGRYFKADRVNTNTGQGQYEPVLTGMLYVAAANGVVYALDAFGNNDNYYSAYHPSIATPLVVDNGVFGTYQPGTTNVLWTFSPTSKPQMRTESRVKYFQRLKTEVPATVSFGASAPVLAYAKDEHDNNDANPAKRIRPLDPTTPDELRLFVGNSNGVLYALDASAKGGIFNPTPTTSDVRFLPVRKGENDNIANLSFVNVPSKNFVSDHRTDLKWWFGTRGPINQPATVSLMRQNAGGSAPAIGGVVPVTKGVYVAGSEGRIYCLDWDGPVSVAAHSVFLNWDGTNTLGATTAESLNDNYDFHNLRPANSQARADLTEGTVRPRWTFPNLYRSTKTVNLRSNQPSDLGVDNSTRQTDAYDINSLAPITGIGAYHLAEQESVGIITTPPVLMDFVWKDPLTLGSKPQLRSYVTIVAGDPPTAGAITASRVYLVDAVGDRVNFLSNTVASRNGAGAPIFVRSQARDRWSPKVVLSDGDLNGATPTAIAWAYRNIYDVYPAVSGLGPLQDFLDDRNSPTFGNNNALTTGSNNENYGRPSRRTLPTLYVGGVGRVYGLDIDPETGIFMRWRADVNDMRRLVSLPDVDFIRVGGHNVSNTNGTLYPKGEASADLLPPLALSNQYNDPFFGRTALRDRRVFARVASFLNADISAATSMTISGGMVQNRNFVTPLPQTGTAEQPYLPSVPPYPTNDAPLQRPWTATTDPTYGTAGFPPSYYTPDIYAAPVLSDVRVNSLSTRVNQDINDAVSTTRARRYSKLALAPPLTPVIQPEPPRVFNQAYQYPILYITTKLGFLEGISSNIEGEDYSPNTATPPGPTSSVSWGIADILENQQNTYGHVYQIQQDLLGSGASGVAMLSPAYYPALDPTFTNTTRENYALANPSPIDRYPHYPFASRGNPQPTSPNGEPNVDSPTPPAPLDAGGTPFTLANANNDDPRPDFHVRPLSPGRVAYTDTNQTPNVDVVQILPDRHTGQTGFPLDLNGLFFDKRFAGQGTRAATDEPGVTVYNETFISAQPTITTLNPIAPGTYTGVYPYANFDAPYNITPPPVLAPFDNQDPNGDFAVGLRLPAYSDIGTGLAASAQVYNNQQNDGVRGNRITGNLVPLNTETPAYTSTDTVYDITAPDPANNQLRGDDINPAGQNVAWLYVGGSNGVLFAFTPSAPGQQSGNAGGQSEENGTVPGSPTGTSASGGSVSVDIFDQTEFNALQTAANTGTATRPDRTKAIAFKGGKNFYEWGETVYIALYDVFATTLADLQSDPNYDPNISGSATIGDNATVNVRIIAQNGGGVPVYQRAIPLIRVNNKYSTYPVVDPNDPTITTKKGLALLAFRLDRPAGAKALTPGDILTISASLENNQEEGLRFANGDLGTADSPPDGFGSNQVEANANNPAAVFAIANPLGVQGFATQTSPSGVTNQLMPVGVKRANASDTTGGIGPFFADTTQTGTVNFTKGEIIDSASVTNVTPDKLGGRYSQALTNGNQLTRRDLSRLVSGAGGYTLNPRFNQILKDANGGDEPAYYFPIAAGTGYIGHGTSGSTTSGKFQGLRIVNRSILETLRNVRVQPQAPLLWHSWPGRVLNVEGDRPAVGTDPAQSFNNPRFTPVGMDTDGRINRLPWETDVAENKPWANGSGGTVAPATNQSPDYPDILLTRTTNLPHIIAGGSDLGSGTGTLPAYITPTVAADPAAAVRKNTSAVFAQNLYGPGLTQALPDNMAVSVSLTIPKYQSANLVGTHSLTSIFQQGNQFDDPAGTESLGIQGTTQGPVQLPKGYAARLLHESNAAGTNFDGPLALAPWGYSTKMVAFVDSDQYPGQLYPPGQGAVVSGNLTGSNTGGTTKAFREFEVWVGVPVDMGLRMVEDTIDLGSVGHGFALQNGLLGYGAGGAAYQTGFLPTPLYNSAAFPAVTGITQNAPYAGFTKSFSTQNIGNVNLWNLRASQKIEKPTTLAQAGSGQPFTYFGMRSDAVDGRFGILAVGADPLLAFMPQVITSLDPVYDGLWDNYIAAQPAYGLLTYTGSSSDTPYARYYSRFAGHHTLHKALPGATAPSVLGIPDVPTAQSVYLTAAGAPTPPAPTNFQTVVGVAVPLGTPVGQYSSKLADSPLVVFEDHDTTSNGYQAVPTPIGTNNITGINAAGPTYGGRNSEHFADTTATGGAVSVLTSTGGVSDGTLRARRFNAATKKLEYLPYTDPTFNLKITVKETALTGQAPDRALASTGLPPAITTGLLPSVDAFPLIGTGVNKTGGVLYLAANTLSPAAYRSANGQLHTYFARNATDAVTATPQTGQAYNLFASHLNWDVAKGVWVASNVGVPIASDAAANMGRWFSAPSVISVTGQTAGSSNVSPYVLQEQGIVSGDANGNVVGGAATLFFLHTVPTASGATANTVYYAPLANDGSLSSAPQPYITNANPSLQRFSPRAVYAPDYTNPGTGTTLLFTFGGVPGRFALYYSPRAAVSGGTPTGTAPDGATNRAEYAIQIPAAVVSATDPSPVVRRMFLNGSTNPTTVVDLYYTGVSRATQTPDIYLTRFELTRSGTSTRLTPVTLPRIYGERLTAPGREPLWHARHIAWLRDLDQRNRLPIIYVGSDPTNAGAITSRNNWSYDNATGLLYQAYQAVAGLTIVYVDTSAGTVRFRGPGTPRATDYVFVDYQPQTFRVAQNGSGDSNSGTFGLVDQSVLPASIELTPTNAVLKRQSRMYADRSFVFWQKGARPGQPASLFYSARRVGVDLKTALRDTAGTPVNGTALNPLPPVGANETIANNLPNAATGNQIPQVTVTLNGASVPYDVDSANARIYVTPQAPVAAGGENETYENLPVTITAQLFNSATQTYRNVTVTNVLLTQLEERSSVGVPMGQRVNEASPYAFVDTFQPVVTTPRNPTPYTGNLYADPTLQPGRLHLFWTSPRGREGTVIKLNGVPATTTVFDPFPSGYDVFWETLAPSFDPLLYSVPR